MIEDDGCRVRSDEWYEGIDPGIRFAVRVLHAKGIHTGQSCQGGEGHCYEYPTVDLWGQPLSDYAGFAALAALADYGIEVRAVSFEWRISPPEAFWRIELVAPLHERADDRPSFAWSYTHYPKAAI